jgi:drug/metabolite transporter (DMT)-like permease
MFLAVTCYSINDALIKWLSDSYHPTQIVFCRSLFVFFIPLGMAFQKQPWKSLKSNKKRYHVLRAVITTLSMFFYIYSFSHLPLADAYALAYVSPFFMALFSSPLLGEKVTPHAWIAIVIGFCGVLIIARPGSSVFSFGGLAAFIAGMLYALSLVMSRKLSQTESDTAITLWFMGTCFVISGLMMPFYWQMPLFEEWALFISLGVAGGTAVMAITRAFSLAPAFIVGPLDYLSFVFGTLIGYVIWGDIPDIFVVTGVFLLIFGGLYLVYQEARRKAFVFAPPLEE